MNRNASIDALLAKFRHRIDAAGDDARKTAKDMAKKRAMVITRKTRRRAVVIDGGVR